MKNYKELLKDYTSYSAGISFEGQPSELYEPANYILSLGGKRVRPLMVLLGYQLFDQSIQKAMPLAHAVEVFHNFTLMHDDIMDHAEVRRGKPTVHKKWNENIAILSGDLMLVKAYRILSDLDADTGLKTKLIQDFSQMAEEVCVGQQFDMNFETVSDITEEEYIRMIELKTSVLLAFSLQAGGMLAGADQETTNALYAYGLNIGLAFQVMDDYLDTFG
ncbi:MAG: polyprenyl synthetase family protein, partial [Bacteroidia bacterium]|nr:polyprenyl synthetase family protein [Bacteroidia bacterium]